MAEPLVSLIKESLSDFYHLFYPSFCPGCSDVLESNERTICTKCRVDLPRTQFNSELTNQVEKVFWGKGDVERATAFLQFHKDSAVMNLLHHLKYKGREDVGELLGRMFYSENYESNFFKNIDLIVPVPLHLSKKRIRGYNQCDSICRGISNMSGIKVEFKGLRRNKANASQTSKNRFERWQNTDGLFEIDSVNVKSGMHILLIDDVITTGSTLEACIKPLFRMGCKVSVACMATPID